MQNKYILKKKQATSVFNIYVLILFMRVHVFIYTHVVFMSFIKIC